jgi:SP family general alpha glucoside:H+ symporter-like MFS transporter
MNIAMTPLINPDAANLSWKIGFIFGGTISLALVCVFLRLPETAHRKFEELDWLFGHRVPARKFKGTVVERDNL